MSADNEATDLRTLQDSADALLEENRYEEARSVYRRLVGMGDISARTTNNLLVAEESERVALALHVAETAKSAAATLYRAATLHGVGRYDGCVALCTSALEAPGLERLDEMRLRIWRLKAACDASRPHAPSIEEDIDWLWQRGENPKEIQTLRATVVSSLERLGAASLPTVEALLGSPRVDSRLQPFVEAKRAEFIAANTLRASIRSDEP